MAFTYKFWQNRAREQSISHPSNLYEIKYHDDHVLQIGKSGEPHYNSITEVRKNIDNIENFISEKIRFFADRQSSFTWIATDYCQPSNLHEFLEKQGLSKLDHAEHLVFDLEKFPIPVIGNSEKFSIKEESLELELSSEFQKLLRTCFPQYEKYDLESVIEAIHQRHKERGEKKIIIAFYDNNANGDEKLVAYSNLIIMDENPKLGYLGGSATLPEFRKQGIYTNSIALRLQVAKNNQCKYVYVGADIKSSAPILKKYGFKKVYDTISYLYNFEDIVAN